MGGGGAFVQESEEGGTVYSMAKTPSWLDTHVPTYTDVFARMYGPTTRTLAGDSDLSTKIDRDAFRIAFLERCKRTTDRDELYVITSGMVAFVMHECGKRKFALELRDEVSKF
jgi:hypothetical protein